MSPLSEKKYGTYYSVFCYICDLTLSPCKHLSLLLCQVTASSWLTDLRDQVERNKVLNIIFRSATAVGSRLPSIKNAKARVAGAGAFLRPVSSSTQVCFIFSINMENDMFYLNIE